MLRLALTELAARLRSPAEAEALSLFGGTTCVLVDVDGADAAVADNPHATTGANSDTQVRVANCVVIAVTTRTQLPALVDVAVRNEAEAASIADVVARQPLAASLLVQLLRHNERSSVSDGLFAESLAYSSLQHSTGFRSWLTIRQVRPPRADPAPPVLLDRHGDVLHITLNRPHRRNAYSAALRDGLCEALHLLADDASITHAMLTGNGPSFSAGGDLDEFGDASDAAQAHASRSTRNAGALMFQLRDRLRVRVHGACVGAGIELPAFAGHLEARADAFFQLPEVSMGLVPGAGGTVSILRRVGRQRLALMALGGQRIDAQTAAAWGLIDRIAD